MAVLVDTLYGEKCCNKDIKKISYETCKQCEYKVTLSKTFVTCHLDTNKPVKQPLSIVLKI
jgi:hypothetical protein